MGGGESLLAYGSNAGEEDLAGVTVVATDGGGVDGGGAGLLQRLGHGGGFVRIEDAAFRSIGNAGCGWEPADLALVFGIQNSSDAGLRCAGFIAGLHWGISCVMRQRTGLNL